MIRIRNLLLLGALLLPMSVGVAGAQVPAAPRELGMGGAYMGVARGYEAVFLAPGNFGLADAPVWSFGFPQVALGSTLVGPEFTDLPDFLDFDDVGESRQTELLALIPNSGTAGEFSFRAPIAALSSGGLGVGIAYNAVGRHTLSRDLAELLLEGYEEGRTDYAVGNTFGERASYWDLAVGYGRNLGRLSVGATAHYIRGGTIVRSRMFEPRIFLATQDIEVDYVGVLARGGSGYGLDLGAAYIVSPNVTMSAAVSNAVSGMDWSEDLLLRDLTLDREMIDNATPRDLLNRYEATERPLEPTSAPSRAVQTAQGLYDEAEPPAVSRIGVSWRPASGTHLAADVHHKLTDGRLGDSWDQRVSVGVQQVLPIIKLRAGYAVANDGGNMLTGGLSLGPLDIGVARFQLSDLDDVRTRGWIATFGLGVAQPY
ncbi:MAG: hypothetical protein WD737_10285 [Gemmatimonadota bacterium]